MVATRVLHSGPTIFASPAFLAQPSAAYLLNVIILGIFSIFRIVTRAVTSYGQHAASSSPLFSPPNPPRLHGKMGTHLCSARKLMRWLLALFCFIDTAKIIDTLRTLNPDDICSARRLMRLLIALLCFIDTELLCFIDTKNTQNIEPWNGY